MDTAHAGTHRPKTSYSHNPTLRQLRSREINQEEGNIQVEKVGTKDQLADIMTKALGGPTFQDLRTRIGIIQKRRSSGDVEH